MEHHDGPVSIIWYDNDGRSTIHNFSSPSDPALDSWLESVLKEYRDDDFEAWLKDFGGPDNGTALLVYYEANAIDELGDFEVFFGNVQAGIFDLYAAANPSAPCNQEE